MSEPYLIAGVDEVGRGPLAGPVVAAAVILNPARPITGLMDSKVLNEASRKQLSAQILAYSLAWAICEASVTEIDRLNILHASLLAMHRAVTELPMRPDLVLVDGNRCPPELDRPVVAVVKGDARVQAISAASIIAKVARDRQMVALHAKHPQYGFDRNKGYPTARHREALATHGVLSWHRRSFAPVRLALAGGACELSGAAKARTA